MKVVSLKAALREHALGEMTKFGQGIKDGTSYRVQTASQTTTRRQRVVEVL